MRTEALKCIVEKRRLDAALVFGEANVRALTGIPCDNACLAVTRSASGRLRTRFYTDFRYVAAVRRLAPGLEIADISRLGRLALAGRRIGYEPTMTHARYLGLAKSYPRARFVDISEDLAAVRAVKTPEEIARLRAAVALNDAIWAQAQTQFAPGMTEREMARTIRRLMIDRGDGEAFETIVCVGANAAECHHEPDDTVWDGRAPVLVDMGVRLEGYCSDMTRCLKPRGRAGLYAKVYDLVLAANRAAIAAARPGVTGRELDKVARDLIADGGFGNCFGHSLGHGVGLEIHEPPYASRRSETVLEPGMFVTIEPGIYLEGNLGVRIEDLVMITETGCEVLTTSAK